MNTGDALLEHFLLAFADAGEGCSDRGDPRMAAALILLSSVSLVAVAAGRRYSATRERRLADVAGDGSRLVVDNDSSASSSSSYNYMRPRLAITDRPRLAITWKDHDDADMSEESGDMPDRVEHITEEVMSDNVERTDMASTPTATERGDTRPTISGAVTIIADMVSSAVTFTAARDRKRLLKRLHIATELLTTERTYNAALDRVHTFFYQPLTDSLRLDAQPLVAEKYKVQAMFGNLQEIRSVNAELLRQLEVRLVGSARRRGSVVKGGDDGGNTNGSGDPLEAVRAHWDPAVDKLGDVFLSLSPYLKMYAAYVKNFNQALRVLSYEMERNERMRSFVRIQSSVPELASLTLQSYLLMPAQRIPRYRLLLCDLLENTPYTHPDYQDVVDALATIEAVATYVNEEIRRHESHLTTVDLQNRLHGYRDDVDGENARLVKPGRKFLRKGTLMKLGRRDHQPRYFILFNDMLVYASIRSATIGGTLASMIYPRTVALPLLESQEYETYTFHRAIPLATLRVVDLPEPSDDEASTDEEDCEPHSSDGMQHQDHGETATTAIAGIQNAFLLLSNDKSFQVYASSAKEKREWIDAIQEAIEDLLYETPVTLATRSTTMATGGQAPSSSTLRSMTSSMTTMTVTPSTADASPAEYCAPVWIPDHACRRCMACQEDFTFFRRKHHCRKCGRVCCHNCSSRTFIVPGAKGSADRIERACDPCYFEMYRLEAEMAAAEHAPKPPTGLLPPASGQRPISSSAVTKVAVGARFSVRVEDAASDMLTTPLNKRDSAVSMDGVRQVQAAPSASRISVADTAAITQMPPSPLLAAVDLSTSLRSHILPAYFGALVYIVHRYFGYVAAPTVQEESGATITELPDDDSTTVAPSIARRLSETMASLQSILLTDRKRTAETSTSSRDRSVTFDVADTPKERRQRNPYDIISRRSQLRIETVLVEEQTHDVLYPLRAGKSATTFSAGDTDFPAAHDGGNDESDDGSDSEAKTVLPRQHKRARSMSNMSTRTAAERLPDHAQHVKDCQLCAEPFAIFRWRHECQQCHRIVCGTCASRKKVLGLAGVDTGDHPLLSPTIMRERGFAYGLTPLSPGSEVEAKRDRGEATAAGDPVRVCDLCFYAGDLDRTAAARTLSLGKRHRSKSTVILLGDPSSVSPASATFPRSPISPAATTPPPLRLGAPVRFNTIRRYDEWLDEGLSRKRTRSAASDRQTKHKRGTSTVF